ncbi:MAG TPA: PAS domain-containing protein, partial [Novosphingobium sp.]
MKAETPARGSTDWLVVAGALAVSALLLWLITRQPLVVAVFSGSVMTLGAVLRAAVLRKAPPVEVDFALPDWSVTVTAIDRPDAAVAVTDRAGRLVCANARFEEWFGASFAPPRLPVDEASLERLARASRAGWRDGKGRADLLEAADAERIGQRWRAEAERTGRGDDFLIWRFFPILAADPVAELVQHLDGKLGRALDQAGIVSAIVDPDGMIRAASAGFALRAAGDALTAMTGQAFVPLLQQEEGDRISWARDGRRGVPLTLYYLPVADPDISGGADPDTTPSLMLLVEAGAGIGNGPVESSAAVPHLEALLGQLPLGLAMADRDGRLLFANAAFLRAAMIEGEGLPTYPTDLVVREDKGALSDAIRRFGQGSAPSGDIAIRLTGQPDEPV